MQMILFLSFNNIEDQVLIQDYINYLTSWCSTNLMNLNVKNFKHMDYSRSSPSKGFYTMNGTVLELVNSFKDLEIIFDCKLISKNHISLTVSKATCILVFIKRWAKEFSDTYITKQFFTTLICPVLEYESVIRHTQYAKYSDKIESVQI